MSKVVFELVDRGADFAGTDTRLVFNVVFVDTGEIRQKRRSMEWLMRRVFESELKTWKSRWGDELDVVNGKD